MTWRKLVTPKARVVEDESRDCVTDEQRQWPRLRRLERLAVALTLVTVIAVTIRRLPPGICFDDAGDLQLASTTLGIMHSPGYAGYVTLGYVVTRLPGVDPAYMVSLACLASGVATLLLCILMQVRLGVSAWVACAWSLVLLAHPRMWSSLVAPEVYAPSLMFLVATAYLVLKYARLGVRRDLLIAASLFGMALANRPPVLFTLPFFLIAWWSAGKRWREVQRSSLHLPSWRRSAATLSLATACAALPGLYVVGYLTYRDRPDAAYNYIEQFNRQWKDLPDSDAGWEAKLQRVAWQVSGTQFTYLMGNSWRGVRQKLRWLRHEVFAYAGEDVLSVIVLLSASGLTVTFRKRRVTAWVLTGLAVVSVVLAVAYRAMDQPVDLLVPVIVIVVQGGTMAMAAIGLVLTYRRCRATAWLLMGTGLLTLLRRRHRG